MTDLEILNLAAKAAIGAGMPLHYGPHALQPKPHWQNDGAEWRPLTDDGDALRLGAALRLHILHNDPGDSVLWVSAVLNKRDIHGVVEFQDEVQRADATRRAIVRAAAEMGKTIE